MNRKPSEWIASVRIPTSALLFCFFFTIYALVIYGQVRYGDEAERYLQAQSLVERWSFSIPVVPAGGITGVGGVGYSQFELGYGLILVPFYALGHFVSSFLPLSNRDWIPVLFVSLSNPIITALTCSVFFRFSRTLGIDRWAAICATAIFGLGTIALPYSKGLYREAIQGLTLLSAAYTIFVFRRRAQLRWLWISGFSFGYLAFVKVSNLSMLPLFLGYLFFVTYEQSVSRKARLVSQLGNLAKVLVVFLLPVLLLLAIQGSVNVVKFGDFFNIGPYNYGNPLPYFSLGNLAAGINGLLFSPSKSLFIFAPPALLFLPATLVFFLKDKVNAISLFLLVAYNVAFAASYVYWDGGSYWGPRYLVGIIPLMILPLGFLIQMSPGWRSWLARIVTAGVFLVGVMVQVVGALISDREYLDVMGRPIDVTGGVDFLRHAAIDSLAFSVLPADGLWIQPFGWVLLLLIVLLGLLLFGRARMLVDEDEYVWNRMGAGIMVVSTGTLLAALVVFLAMTYPTALEAKGDTRLTAGESFRADGRPCEAQAMYRQALYLGTRFERQSVARLEEITPMASGISIELDESSANPTDALVERDSTVSLLGETSLKISVPVWKETDVEVDSQFIPVTPNTAYDISGWLKAEGVTGSGAAVIGWYEDNAKWRQARNIDLSRVTGTQGWQPFRQMVTTSPTTQRILLKAGLWKSYGTIWVDGIRLAKLDEGGAAPAGALCVPETR